MFAKHLLIGALGATLAAVTVASHAESNTEWLQRQLQVTDGYSPPLAGAMPRNETANKETPFEGTSMMSKQQKPTPPTYRSGGFEFRSDGRVFLPNGQEISAP